MRHAPPPQPSSTVTTLRALVMIACLVGIPTMALRGTAFSAMIREYLVQKLGGSIAETDTMATLDEAPPFVPAVTGAPELSSGFSDAPSSATPGIGLDRKSHDAPSFSLESEPQASPPRFSGPGLSEQAPPFPATIRDRSLGQPGQQADAVLANYDRPSQLGDRRSQTPTYPPNSVSGPGDYPGQPQNASVGPPPQAAQTVGESSTVDQFLYIQQRLRDLGADYYLLENWGNEGKCYRFHCRVAVANSDNFSKHFEATDEQPLGAMTRVLADVEAWRRGSPTWEAMPNSPLNLGQLPNRAPPQPTSPHGPYVR